MTFTVYGVPQPQGSMKSFIPKGWKRAVLTSDNKQLKTWRQEMAHTAQAAMCEQKVAMIRRPLAIRVECEFYFAKPKSAKKLVLHKTTKPDSDKLCRSVGDALTGICYEDDSQICEWSIGKYFDLAPRTCVRLTVLSPIRKG